MFSDGERYRIKPVKMQYILVHTSDKYFEQTWSSPSCWSQKQKRQIYTQLYWYWDIGDLHMLLRKKCVHNRGGWTLEQKL